jgi:hypothetical protein
MRRRLLYALLIFAVLASIATILLKPYLTSRLTPQVAARLRSALGMPVEFSAADVGLAGDSALDDVRVYEPAPAPAAGSAPATPAAIEKPWLRIGRVEADVSIIGFLRGATVPRQIHLSRVAVTLRFDKNDQLLTHLPSPRKTEGALPNAVIDDATLTIEQEGRDPLKLAGINAKLVPAAGKFEVKGSIADTEWGKWHIAGAVDPGTADIRLTLNTPEFTVDTGKLSKVPFVSPAIWQQVSARGKTPVRLSLDLSTTSANNHCRVELAPTDASLRVAAIDLNTDHVAGQVIVDDKKVTLTRLAGQTAAGTIAVGGTLDFRTEPASLALDVQARNVDVQRLPRSWDLPQSLDGRLTGDAKLRLRLTEPTIDTEGSAGAGVVTGVRVLGLGKGEARLFLHAGPGRFSFRHEPPAQKSSGSVVPQAPPPVAVSSQTKQPTGRSSVLAGALNNVTGGLGAVTGTLTTGATTTIRWLRQLDQLPPSGKPPTYFESNLSLQDVDLGELLRRAKLGFPFPVTGKLSFQVNIGFPIDAPRDFKAYRFRGSARLSKLNVAGFAMSNVRADVRYADGVLSLDSLQGEIPGATPAGSFNGSARYQLLPAGDLTASLHVDHLPLGLALRLLPNAGQTNGDVSGSVQFRNSGGRLGDPSSWEGNAVLRSSQLRAYGMVLKDLSMSAAVSGGTLTVNNLKGSVAGAPFDAKGTLKLANEYAFTAGLSFRRVDVSALRGLAPALPASLPIGGRVDVTSNLKGTLRPRTFDASGTARATELTVGGTRMDALSFGYTLESARLRLVDLKAELFRGTVTGSASLPLRTAESGEASLRVSGVDLRALTKATPSLPLSLEGIVSGTLTGKIPAASADGSREATADVDLSAPDLTIQGISTKRVRGTVTYRNGTASYRMEGEVAGGTFKLEGPFPASGPDKAPSPTAEPPRTSPQTGTLQLRNVHVGRLFDLLQPVRRGSQVRGTLDADLNYRFVGPNAAADGRGRFVVSRLRWGDVPISDRLQGEVRLGPQGLAVSDASGALAGGEIRLSAGCRLGREATGTLNLDLFGAEMSQLLSPFPGLAGLASGPADISLRVSGGREWRGSGRVVLTRGRALGVMVSDWRVPLDFSFFPDAGGRLEIRDSSAQIAAGRAHGRASLTWGDTTRLDGNVHFFDADLRTLLGRESEVANYASGKLSGSLDFDSEQFRSADDINATLSATLSQTQAASVPLLTEVIPFLGLIGGTGSTRFQNGEIRGQLTHGTFHIQHFTLTGTILKLIFEGDVTLGGRLNLEVTATSGNFGVNTRGFEVLGLRLPAIGPLPLALIVDASAFLANRVVHLRVTGTVASPVVRAAPTALLSQEAVRYFLSRTGLPVTP